MRIPTVPIMQHLDDFPTVTAARASVVRAQGDLATTDSEIAALLAARRTDESRTATSARAYLDDAPVPPDDKEAEEALRTRRRMLLEAVALARAEVTRAEHEASREIAEALVPVHQANVEALCRKFVELVEAHETMLALTEGLDDAGVRWTSHLRPMRIAALGRASDRESMPARFLRECEEYGLLGKFFPPEEVLKWQ